MTTAVTFPVPSTTTSRFAVAAERIPHDLAGLFPLPLGMYDLVSSPASPPLPQAA